MINMGLKMADICDLDNRPENIKFVDSQNKDNVDLSASMISDMEGKNEDVSSALLNPRNYPFYHKIKRSMYVIEKLLNDENN